MKMYIVSNALVAVVLLAGCNREPRSMSYFEKHLDEAQAVAADTKNCLGLDQTKVLTGADECTNAHLALRKAAIKQYNDAREQENAGAFKAGTVMPRLKGH